MQTKINKMVSIKSDCEIVTNERRNDGDCSENKLREL